MDATKGVNTEKRTGRGDEPVPMRNSLRQTREVLSYMRDLLDRETQDVRAVEQSRNCL